MAESIVNTVEYWKSPVDRKWYWHARAYNGEIVAHSEGYTRKVDAKKTARGVFPEAKLVEVDSNAVPRSEGKQPMSDKQAVRSSK